MACSLQRFWLRYAQWTTGFVPNSLAFRQMLLRLGDWALELHTAVDPTMLHDVQDALSDVRVNERLVDHGQAVLIEIFDLNPSTEDDLGS